MRLLSFLLLIHSAFAAQTEGRIDNEAVSITRSTAALLEAEKHMLLEAYEDAQKHYEKSLDHDIHNDAAHYRLAQLSLYNRDYPRALEHVHSAIKLSPGNRHFILLQAEIYERANKPLQAVRARRTVLELAPDDQEQRYEIARLYLRAKKEKKAWRVYNEIEREVGYTEEIGRKKHALLLQLKNYRKALHETQRLMVLFPDVLHFHLLHAELLLKMNQSEAASRYLEGLWEKTQKDIVNVALVEVYLQRQKWAEAEQPLMRLFKDPLTSLQEKLDILSPYMELLIRQRPTLFGKGAHILLRLHQEEERAYALMGDLYLVQGRTEEALSYYEQALLRGSIDLALWQRVIGLQIELSRLTEALGQLGDALIFYPEQFYLYLLRGDVLSLQEQHEEAVSAYQMSLQRCSNDTLRSQIQARLGDAFHALKDYTASEEAYEQALLLDADNAHALNNYSYFLALRKKNLTKAETLAERLVGRHGKDPTYLDTYAWVVYTQGRYRKAFSILRKAIRLGAKDGIIYEHYGDACYRLGKVNSAVAQWRKAAEKGGGSSAIEEKIKQKRLSDAP